MNQHLTQAPIKVSHSTATGPQSLFWNNSAPFRLYVGGVGAGKTRCGVIETFRMPKRTKGAVVAPTYRMLKDSTLVTFKELAQAGGLLRRFNISDMSAELVNGTQILFRSADEPDRLRGTNLGWVYLDEGALAAYETWLILIARLREPPGRGWVCTTPRGYSNWTYEVFAKADSPDYWMIRASTRSNTFLPPDFIPRLEQQYTYQWQQQEIEGEFCDLQGAMFKRQWFIDDGRIVEHCPEGLRWCRYWDLAASTKTQADFSASACVAMLRETGDVYIRNVIKMKSEWPDVRKTIIETALAEKGVTVGIESAMHGLAGVQELMRVPELVGTTIRSIRVDKDKVSRALPVASRAEMGKVKLVRGNWVTDFLDEATSFPHGKHDDQVDAVSGAFQMLTSDDGYTGFPIGLPKGPEPEILYHEARDPFTRKFW